MTFEEEFPDSNRNGIPDAFENRPSIIEILNSDEAAIIDAVPVSAERLYQLFVPEDGGVILLEIKNPHVSTGYGALLFRTRQEVADFVSKLSTATLRAFGEAKFF